MVTAITWVIAIPLIVFICGILLPIGIRLGEMAAERFESWVIDRQERAAKNAEIRQRSKGL